MQIREVADMLGTNSSAIRFYEKEGLLPNLEREGGRRFFLEKDVLRLKVLTTAKRMGFTLREIKLLLTGLSSKKNRDHWIEMAEQKKQELDLLIRDAKRMKRLITKAEECGCLDLETCRVLR